MNQTEAAQLVEQGVPVLDGTFKQLSDIYLLHEEGYLPIRGFQGAKDVQSVAGTMHLSTGEPWSIPIVFPVSDALATSLSGKERFLVKDQDKFAALITIEDIFEIDKDHYAKNVFRTDDKAHPGVDWLTNAGEKSIAGSVDVIDGWELRIDGGLPMSPRKVRAEIESRGWKNVVGFQTRNPIHRAHEFMTKTALELADGLVIHPLMGDTKSDDIPVDVRLKCYRVLIDKYYSKDHTLLAGFPAWMRYGGPREAVFHVQVRKNYGITRLIVGRDHAGVGNYYGPFDAQNIFSEFQPGELGADPIFFNIVFYSRVTGDMASPKTAPSSAKEDTFHLSGTKVREMLRNGERPPPEFTRPEVAEILVEAFKES